MSYLFTMPGTNVSLSAEELRLVCDPSWLLMKQDIIRKVYEMFADSARDINRIFIERGVFDIYAPAVTSPKISKGENYLGLPWVMLDYPRVFGQEDVFSLRTFFWWGHFFSISVHLAGRYRRVFLERFSERKKIPEGFHVCVHETPWQHYFESDNLVGVKSSRAGQLMKEMDDRPFLKWAQKFELVNWNQMPDLLKEGYGIMADFLV